MVWSVQSGATGGHYLRPHHRRATRRLPRHHRPVLPRVRPRTRGHTQALHRRSLRLPRRLQPPPRPPRRTQQPRPRDRRSLRLPPLQRLPLPPHPLRRSRRRRPRARPVLRQRRRRKGFSDPSHQLGESDLLSHEFTHSWNGKYRRPFNLYQDDFEKMQQGSLLWVYEGMTQYLGNVLAARSGLKSQEQYRDMLALSAANLDYKPGREWRSTEDTAISASILRGGNPAWSNWKRGQDYYQEGELFWLDADTLIRQKTDNKKSLTDFLHLFLGKGGNTGPSIVTYNRDELIADLNQVYKYDWATFIHERIDNINPRADLAGIERGGYKLVFTDEPTKSERTLANSGSRRGSSVNVWYSSASASPLKATSPTSAGTAPPTRRSSSPERRSSPSTATSTPPTPSRPQSSRQKEPPSPSTSSSRATPSSPPPTSTTMTAPATHNWSA
ncbi:hypothetical protein RBB78_12430 [Tunturiibacter empetritectus]|uniref:M61 family metallopeptidase n=1 Tax=Tunturiibacter empetritectus TaxID=3069691 RepID=UPI003D9BF837